MESLHLPCNKLIKGTNTRKFVHFGEITIKIVPRIDYLMLVGDVRDSNNPNYLQIALMRHYRLSAFWEESFWNGEDPLEYCFKNWKISISQ